MRKNTYYYGGIVARISGILHEIKPEDMAPLYPNNDETLVDALCDISADAGRVFHTMEDLSDEHFINWSSALDYFSQDLKHTLLSHRKPAMADMISLAANSIDLSKPDQKPEGTAKRSNRL